MKKLNVLLCAMLWSVISYGQQNDKDGVIHPTSFPVIYHGQTGRLDQFQEAPGTINEVTKTEKLGYHAKNDWHGNQFTNPNALPKGEDPVLQKSYAPAAQEKALTQGWDGIGYTGVNPADPSVDVGPNHVVQMINGSSGSYIQVYSKTGTPIGAQVYFDNFMSLPGGAGDPIVMYDERADRWFLSEFSQTGNNLHIAISTTPDPGGTYHTYSFNSPGGFPDYPKYSIWENEYVMTANVNTPDIFAFNRTDLLAGTATTAQQFSQTNFGTIGFQASTPVSMNGTTVPPSGQPALLMRMRDDAWTGSASDALEMWELDIDWTTPGNSTLSQVQTLGIAPHDSELCGYTSFQCFPQPGTGTTLDPLRELLMNRIHYRNFGTHESIVCCHVTDVDGTDRGGIRWYELRRTGGTAGTWTIHQEGTYSPDTDNRWMASICISASGNIGLAYSVANGTSVYPSLRYTGRKECDPLGTMTEPETVLIAGTASNGSNRWGDYFQMGLDPSDGETFYHTGCYNTSAQWSTRISAFDLPTCSPQVSFGASTYSENESNGTTANGCLPYVDLIIPISIASPPSEDATVTVNVAGGTATNTVDYDILNVTHTLNAGNLSGNVTIRIYNDDYVEGTETITLDYTLNPGTGNAVAGATNQTVTITINDDDLAPAAMLTSATILSEDFEVAGVGIPTGFSTANNGTPTDPAWQFGNNAAASSGAYTIPVSNTTTFAWVNDDACDCDLNDVDLVFPSVDLSNYTGVTLTFSTYFENNTYQTNTESAGLYVSVGGGAYVLVGPLTASIVDGAWVTQNFDLTAYVGNSNAVFKINYSDGTGWLYGCTVDDILMTGTLPIDVQTAVNTGAGHQANLGPNETVHFYDPTSGDVMMTLENTSSFDYGCVTVDVDRAGTAAAQFNTANTADYLHSKTYTVVPSNSGSGSYNMTVYYKEAEVAGWETATGNSRNNAEIVKVDGNNQISDVTPANAGSYTISSTASAVGTFNSDVTFTSSFTGSFSGFGVGIYNTASNTVPTANFSGTPTTICEGQSVSFTDMSTNTPTSWSWDFGDTQTSNVQNPTHTYATAGTYTVTLTATNAFGSDGHTITNYITVNAPVTSSQNVSICPGQSVTVGTSTYTTAGTYTDVLTAANGCDSTVTTTVTLLNPSTNSQSVSICPGQSVTVGTSTYTTAGTYTDVLTAANGCDSTVTTTVTLLNPSTSSQNVSICPSQSVTVGTSTYTTAGTYTDVLTAANGCDSTVTTTVTLLNPSTNSQSVSICPGQSVTVGTSTYTTAGTYTDVLTAANGCDSTVTTTVTLLSPVTSSQNVSICPGQSVTVGTSTYTTAGTYTDVLTAANGCDSTVTTTLTVTSNVTFSQTLTICPGQSVTVGTSTYTAAGTYTDLLVAAGGCDSTVTTTVITLLESTSSQAFDICPGQSITVGTNTYNSAGTYTDVFTGVNGCDSTVTTTITILVPSTFTQDLDICEGSSVTVGTNTYTTSGTYTDILVGANGCDSTVTTNLVVNPNPTVDITPTSIDTMCIQGAGSITLIGDPSGGSFSGTGVTGTTFDPAIAGVGTHTITYSYTDANGCMGSSTVVAVVEDCVNLEDLELEGVFLFPNPNDGIFSINGLEIGANYEIYDSKGRLVTTGKVSAESEKVRISNAESGMYYLHSTKNGKPGSIQFLITK